MNLHYGPGEHALTYYRGEAFVTTPLRIARRQMLAFGIMGSLHNSTEDCTTIAMNHNWQNMGQFLAKCQVKWELSAKVHAMFVGGGLIH
jgi:hypothetical protein